MKKILFVCVENSCRSQMAEGFARLYGKGQVEAFSAGSKPSGIVNPKAVRAMKELGYDLSAHGSKSVETFNGILFHYVITMGCGDTCPFVPAKKRIDWNIPCPKQMEQEDFNKVRDLIGEKVKELIEDNS